MFKNEKNSLLIAGTKSGLIWKTEENEVQHLGFLKSGPGCLSTLFKTLW
jgi:hypothetical protein